MTKEMKSEKLNIQRSENKFTACDIFACACGDVLLVISDDNLLM